MMRSVHHDQGEKYQQKNRQMKKTEKLFYKKEETETKKNTEKTHKKKTTEKKEKKHKKGSNKKKQKKKRKIRNRKTRKRENKKKQKNETLYCNSTRIVQISPRCALTTKTTEIWIELKRLQMHTEMNK